MPRLRTRTIQPWSVEEARCFLESARNERDPIYPAYVLILRHSKIAVTTETCTHIPSELTRNALHKLGDSLEGLT